MKIGRIIGSGNLVGFITIAIITCARSAIFGLKHNLIFESP